MSANMKNASGKLEGIYAGVPTPWKANGDLDADSLVENVRRCREKGLHGMYILGPGAEFWSVNLDEFREMVRVFADALKQYPISAQVFCGWYTTRGVIQRIQICQKAGISTVQLAIPSWFGLTKAEVRKLFADVYHACPEMRVIHYNTPKQTWTYNAEDYARLLEVAPNVVGTKTPIWNAAELVHLIKRTPHLTHFCSEQVLYFAIQAGARGCYSSAVYFNPDSTLRLYRAAVNNEKEEALKLTERFVQFLRETEEIFVRYEVGTDAPYDKLVAHIAGFLKLMPYMRPPYQQLPEEGIRELRKLCEKYPDWVWTGEQASALSQSTP